MDFAILEPNKYLSQDILIDRKNFLVRNRLRVLGVTPHHRSREWTHLPSSLITISPTKLILFTFLEYLLISDSWLFQQYTIPFPKIPSALFLKPILKRYMLIFEYKFYINRLNKIKIFQTYISHTFPIEDLSYLVNEGNRLFDWIHYGISFNSSNYNYIAAVYQLVLYTLSAGFRCSDLRGWCVFVGRKQHINRDHHNVFPATWLSQQYL